MKQKIALLGLCVCLALMGLSTSACSRKTGCPAAENATVKVNRKGRLPSSGGKSQLFPKSMRKKSKKKKKKD